MQKNRLLHRVGLIATALVCRHVLAASQPEETPATLTAEGEAALAEYSQMLAGLRAQIRSALPDVGLSAAAAFLKAEAERERKTDLPSLPRTPASTDLGLSGALQLGDVVELEADEKSTQKSPPEEPIAIRFLRAHAAEGPKVTVGKGADGRKSETRRGGDYSDRRAALEAVELARPILAGLDAFLSSGALDADLVRCAVVANATPRGLALYVQKGRKEKALIDELLADHELMREMLYAGGAKAGRYWRAMEVLRGIQAASPRAREGHFRRLALATSLELAAPELNQCANVEPVKRYLFFETSYLDKELGPAFDEMTTWQYRHVVNDPHTEEDMAWMREMLRNYRPDHITAPEGFRSRYVGLMNSEFGHKSPEWEEDSPYTRFQQTIDRGGQCGPKAFFGRCLSRSFGIPTWGARLRSHTAMTYWTPKGWTTILGVAWHSGFWIADQAEPMRASFFRLGAMARECPDEYIKVCRAQWVGDALGEEKVHGMQSGTGGPWYALALNKMRAIVMDKNPPAETGKLPWELDTYAKEAPNLPEKLMTPTITEADREIVLDSKGVVTIPAVACVSPTGNTDKILFMKSRSGGMQLHYKRFELPEPFTYEVTVPEAGAYLLSAKVVTVNGDQFFVLTQNNAREPVEVKMPYTVGRWGDSEPVELSLLAGRNTLSFTRTAPEDFNEKGWSRSGPEYGGVTIKQFTLTPVQSFRDQRN